MKEKYAQILTDNTAISLDKLFTYKIPKEFENIKIGMRVLVPFGRSNKPIKGIIIDIMDEYNGEYKLKDIIKVIDKKSIISDELIELSKWMKNKYLSSFLSAISLVLPPGDYKEIVYEYEVIDFEYKCRGLDETIIYEFIKKNRIVSEEKLLKELDINKISEILKDLQKKDVIKSKISIQSRINKKTQRFIKLNLEMPEEIIYKKIRSAPKQKQIVEILKIDPEKEYLLKDILKLANTTNSVANSLKDKNVVKIYNKTVDRKIINRKISNYRKHKLTTQQQEVFETILSRDGGSFILHGVTGSGKTEVYLQLVEHMIKKDKQSIILVPEISLTPQTIDRFVGRFGENVAILHSKLSDGERFDQWKKIKNNEVKIVIGARSAIFAPFDNLGLIVIDEYHEDSYKSSQNPKYDTVEVAYKRAKMTGAKLLLGSATPTVSSYYEAILNRKYEILSLEERIGNSKLPEVEIVDMRLELEKGNRSIYSETLYNEIINTLKNKKQVILFLNRRGFSTFVSCRKCGYVVECNNCDISLTYHRSINKLRCHYCGETKSIPSVCPKCGSKYIKYFGIGTQKVEQITKKQFPQANVARLDADTTQGKTSYEDILGKMKNKEIDILVGTQMISKGLDFKDVTLVGIIAADTSLNIPNYNSSEKTFQLVTQVAGRAGRGDYPGKVILQTYEPDHYSLYHAQNHDFLGFYKDEIEIRKMQLYPPFVNLINIIISGENLDSVIKNSKKIYNVIGSNMYHIYKDSIFKYLIGPSPAPLEKIKNRYRYQIIIKVGQDNFNQIINLMNRMIFQNRFNLDFDNISLNVEVNPNSIL